MADFSLAELGLGVPSVGRSLADIGRRYPAEMRSYEPSLRERLGAALMGNNASQARRDFVGGLIGSTGLGSGFGLADLTPLGAVFGAQEAVRAGDYQGAALAAAPFGVAARPARRLSGALPMDKAARMTRAKDMGHYIDMPLAHGTAVEFNSFDLGKAGTTTGSAPAQLGVWAEVRRPGRPADIAAEFAEMAAQRTGGNPQTYDLLHRATKPGAVQLTGREKNHEIAATLAKAWADGFDAVMLRNYTSPGGKSGDIVVVRDPAQLRAPTAEFDPAKRTLPNLLAGAAGVAVLPLAAEGER